VRVFRKAYRGKYLDSAGGNGNVGEGYLATNNIDFSAHYNITPRLRMTVEGLNLTDEHVIQYTDIAAKTDRSEHLERPHLSVGRHRRILNGS